MLSAGLLEITNTSCYPTPMSVIVKTYYQITTVTRARARANGLSGYNLDDCRFRRDLSVGGEEDAITLPNIPMFVSHKRRIYAEDKAKVVDAVGGSEFLKNSLTR